MPTTFRRAAFVIALALALGAGTLLHLPGHTTQAGGGYPPQVLVLMEGVESAAVREEPDSLAVVAEMQPGDRVLRISGAIATYKGGVYIPVITATGDPGWLLNGEDITEAFDPVYASDSQLRAGSLLAVQAEGTPCRAEPTFRSETEQTLTKDQPLLIIAGPYPAELGLWWRVVINAEHDCWLYDAPGLFVLVEP